MKLLFGSGKKQSLTSSPPPSINNLGGTSLVAHWLRLHASSARALGWIPGQETKIPHALQGGGGKKKKNLGSWRLAETAPLPLSLPPAFCLFYIQRPETYAKF